MTETSATQVLDPTADPRRWKALGVIALVQFMLVLDITVVNVALPHIQADLGFSRAGLAWVVDGYVLTAGGLLLLGGRLADLLGRRRMFMIGVAVFAVASALSGFSADPGMLVASRFLQGAGEAMASPAAFGLVALLFTAPKERAQAIGIFGGVAGLGGTLGPVISGLLISVLSWRWIFFVNVPVAVFAVLAVARMVDESRAERVRTGPGENRPDVAGALVGTTGLCGIVYGFIAAGNHPWGSPQVVVPLLGGIAAIAAFVGLERRAVDPLIPARFLRNTTRVTANAANLVFASVFFTVFFLMTLYFEQTLHYSALRTGLAYLPVGLFIGLGIAISSSLVPKVGVKPLLLAGSSSFATGTLLLSRITVHGSYLGEALPGLVVMALGAGLSFAAFGNASMHEVSGQDASLASGVNSTAQSVGGAIGLAVLATLALRHVSHAAAHGVPFPVAATHGADLAFRIGALIALGGAVMVAAIRFGDAPGRVPREQPTAGSLGAERFEDPENEIVPVAAQL
ncbi:MAG TPA: MFS transporter [Acidimicrobiales bacterium]|nr:MFS transporter [Acidimicrobiales bacterium]